MSGTCHKYCFVLSCVHNSKRNPEMHFFRVPYNRLLRDQWCEAVGRASTSLKQSSTAFCCSDHFDMEVDLDRDASSSECPKLNRDAIPSLEHKNNQERNAKAMEVLDIFGADASTDESNHEQPKNLYENDNDRFLEENDIYDRLNIEPESELDNLALPEAVPSVIMPTKTEMDLHKNKEMNASSKINIKQNTRRLSKNHKDVLKSKKTDINSKVSLPIGMKVPVKYQLVPATVVSKPVPVRIGPVPVRIGNTVPVSIGDSVPVRIGNPVPVRIGNPVPVRIGNPVPVRIGNPVPVRIGNPVPVRIRNPVPVRIGNSVPVRIGHPLPLRIGNPFTLNPNVVNKLKYTNLSEFNKQRNKQDDKNCSTQSDDEDCVLVEEQNALKNNADSLITALPKSISIKVSKAGVINTVQPPKLSSKEVSIQAPIQVPLQAPQTSTDALARANTKLRICEFSKVSPKPNVNHDKVYKLIRLMLSENQMLLASNESNCVKIARTKPNEFKIFDNTYYYRTNSQFEKNYFFMNITRNSRHNHEIIQRNYGIFWGNPRVSCVGIVETKGVLDDETKDFVFQQVKKSLFNENGQQNLKLLNVVKPVQLVRENSVPTTTKPITRPMNEAPALINLDDDKSKTMQSNTNKGQQLHTNKLSEFLPTSPRITNVASLDISSTRPMIKLPNPVESPKILQDPMNSELMRLSNFLTPATRGLINKLKHFELDNGSVYTVNIGPYSPLKKRPYDIVFKENKPDSQIQPVSKELYVSKLVNYLFKAIYPFMNGDCTEPIPILSPENVSSDFSAAMVESLIMRETGRIDEQIAALQASMTKQSKVGDKSAEFVSSSLPKYLHARRESETNYKHKCNVCLQKFERKYQLHRHQFVQHSDKTMSTVPDDTTKDVFDETLIIKTEKVEEIDQSLLVPLFEEQSMKDKFCSVEFPFVKCKEEPEVHLEEMTSVPLSIDELKEQTKQNQSKRKACNNTYVEDTDSAPECSLDNQNSKKSLRRKKRKISKTGKLLATAKPANTSVKTKRIERRQNNLKKHSSQVVPIKLTEAKKFMVKWPSLTVDLVDIGNFIEK